jgi:hypothetical protein
MPLPQTELNELANLGELLKSTLVAMIDEFPISVRSIGGMSTHLDYNRSNCQRLLNAVSNKKQGLEVICLLPGPTSLLDFCNKSSKYLTAQKTEKLFKLVTDFQQKIKFNARSHSELKRLLSENNNAHEHQSVLTQQSKSQKLYEAAKEFMGASVETLFCSYILSCKCEDEYLQETAMISKQGNVHESYAPPFVQFYTHPHPNDFSQPSKITAQSLTKKQGFNIGIVEEYSTTGLFEAYTSYSPSNSGIVFDNFTGNRPFNATFLFDNPDELANPITHQSHCSSTSISIRNPTKKLVMLVFLEKSIDMRSSVNVGCYQGNQKVDDGNLKAADMWTERLPCFPDLKVINLNSPEISSASLLNVVELTDYQFNYARLNKQNFVCYMMEIDYPIWSSTYRIYFEHS